MQQMPWVKGQSGNPKGSKKNEDSAANAIRLFMTKSRWKDAAHSLFSVLMCEFTDKDTGEIKYAPNLMTDGREKAAAYNALADRAFGKPIQKQIIAEEKEPPIDSEALEKLRMQIVDGAE
jgi:hypothetical protein